MNSPSKRPTCETQRGDGEVLGLIALTAVALGALRIANCGSVTLDDLAESSPELAAALKECGERFEEAVQIANYNDRRWDCWLTPYDGMVCDYSVDEASAKDRGWVSAIDRSEPEPDSTGIGKECSRIADNNGLKPCFGQPNWNWDVNAGFVHANMPNCFRPAN